MDGETYTNKALTDEQLLQLIRLDSDNNAVNTLIKRYSYKIKTKAARLHTLYPKAEAEDLFSEGLLGLLKAMRCYSSERGAAFSTFADICISSAMKTAAAKAISSDKGIKDSDFDLDTVEDSSPTAEQAMIDKEQDDEFYRKLSAVLSKKEFEVLKLYLENISYGSIAKKLGTSEKSVDNALQRAKSKIRRNRGN